MSTIRTESLADIARQLNSAASVAAPRLARGSTEHRIADYAARYAAERVTMPRSTSYLEERARTCRDMERQFHARREELRGELAANLGRWLDRNLT